MCCGELPDCGFFVVVLTAGADIPVAFTLEVERTESGVALLSMLTLGEFVVFTSVLDGNRPNDALLSMLVTYCFVVVSLMVCVDETRVLASKRNRNMWYSNSYILVYNMGYNMIISSILFMSKRKRNKYHEGVYTCSVP